LHSASSLHSQGWEGRKIPKEHRDEVIHKHHKLQREWGRVSSLQSANSLYKELFCVYLYFFSVSNSSLVVVVVVIGRLLGRRLDLVVLSISGSVISLEPTTTISMKFVIVFFGFFPICCIPLLGSFCRLACLSCYFFGVPINNMAVAFIGQIPRGWWFILMTIPIQLVLVVNDACPHFCVLEWIETRTIDA